VQADLALHGNTPEADSTFVLTVDGRTGFHVREMGYDVGEVVAHIAALEDRIAELESALSSQRDEVSESRMQAFRLLTAAREDAEAMVEEARQQAAAILAAAEQPRDGDEIHDLDPRLEVIKAELSAAKQRAFTSVARRRRG
jgi:cell division septum initiation protein DivIVA